MTVTYTAEVATCKGFGCFLKLLFRWHGSIYKLIWPDLCFFLATYFSLSILYRFLLSPQNQKIFEMVSVHCEKYGTLIPVSFVLGFYVSIVVGRWWDQYKTIPWPDSIAMFVSASIHGQDEKGRLMRRTIMRYCCLSLTMYFTLISPRVKKRFPTLDHLVESGLLLENERKIIDDLNQSVPGYSKTWLPIVWAASIVTRARKEGKIRDDFGVKTILDELNKFRSSCGLLVSYDWISVPLVYTQVVTLAVYSYFFSCIMGRQYLTHKNKSSDELDLVFPLFTTLQFFFYMGWLKVAESLLNPFGDDDDDFELNWLVDRNLQVAYLIVDEMHHEHPELIKDTYWDSVYPPELPYTVAGEPFRDEPPSHSTSKILVSKECSELVSPPSFKIDDPHSYSSNETGLRIPVASSLSNKRINSFFNPNRAERTSSVRSNLSNSTQESIQGSATSVFKRFFNRDRDSSEGFGLRMSERGSGSNANMKFLKDEIIPELDENTISIISARRNEEKKRKVQDIFNNGSEEEKKSSSLESSDKNGTDLHSSSSPINIPENKSTGIESSDLAFMSQINSSEGGSLHHIPTVPPSANLNDFAEDDFSQKNDEAEKKSLLGAKNI